MDKESKTPRICEVLGVEVDELFALPDKGGEKLRIDEYGQLCGACYGNAGGKYTAILCEAINHPERIIRFPLAQDGRGRRPGGHFQPGAGGEDNMTIKNLCAALRRHAALEDKNACRSDLPEILREAADKLETFAMFYHFCPNCGARMDGGAGDEPDA